MIEKVYNDKLPLFKNKYFKRPLITNIKITK